MLRTVLVVIHAGAGIAGLVVGLSAIAPEPPRGWLRLLRRAYLPCVAVLLASLAALLVVDWGGLATGVRLAFGGLAGLGAVMVIRLVLAQREVAAQRAGWQGRYIDHVAFSYIALWVGFLVLPALNLPYPQFTVPAVVVAVIGTGALLVSRYRRRVTSPREPAPG